MPELDKWQKREAEQYARDNDVTYEAAVKVLFPEDEPAAEDEQAEPAAEGEQQAPADAPKSTTAKASRGTVGSKG